MSSTPLPQEPEYAWELATLYPAQGDWSEVEYLELTDHSNRRIEFTDGRLEFLPMPTEIHEALLIPARPMARSPAMKPAEVPETTKHPSVIGRAGVDGTILVSRFVSFCRWEEVR